MPRMGWPIVVIAGSWPIELSRLFMLQCWRRGRSSPTVFMTRHLSAFLRRIEFTSDLFLRQNFIPIDIFIRRNNICEARGGVTSILDYQSFHPQQIPLSIQHPNHINPRCQSSQSYLFHHHSARINCLF